MALRQKAFKYIADIPSALGYYSHYYTDKDYYRLMLRRLVNDYWHAFSEQEALEVLNYIRDILNDFDYVKK